MKRLRPSQVDEYANRAQTGTEARITLRLMGPLLDERQKNAIDQATNDFRTGGLDGARAVAYIATLNEVRAIREELQHRVRQGEAAEGVLHGVDGRAGNGDEGV